MEHTKGAWEVRKEQPNNPDSWEYEIISPSGTGVSHYHIASGMNQANAQLMASAPTMYKRLQEFLDLYWERPGYELTPLKAKRFKDRVLRDLTKAGV